MHDLETLWEVPRKPKGVLFVAHGCSHQGSDFWPASQRCKHCLGLPEEMGVRAAALKRGYAVVAVTSYNRDSRCWHNTQAKRSEDLKVWPMLRRCRAHAASSELRCAGAGCFRLAAAARQLSCPVCRPSPSPCAFLLARCLCPPACSACPASCGM